MNVGLAELAKIATDTPYGALALVLAALLTGLIVPKYVLAERERRLSAAETELARYIRLSRRVRGKRR